MRNRQRSKNVKVKVKRKQRTESIRFSFAAIDFDTPRIDGSELRVRYGRRTVKTKSRIYLKIESNYGCFYRFSILKQTRSSIQMS